MEGGREPPASSALRVCSSMRSNTTDTARTLTQTLECLTRCRTACYHALVPMMAPPIVAAG